MIAVTTLMDNLSSENKALKAEHGLSMWVETSGARFLFDCGAGSATPENARRLGINLKSADFTVCTHSHYDHAAGYRDIAEGGGGGKILYTGPSFFEKKYAFDGTKYTNLSAGFDEDFLRERGVEHRICSGVTELSRGCWLIGRFARTHSFEAVPPRFVKGEAPFVRADDFSDEICLALETAKGLVVLVGCSHPGILNMIETVHSALNKPIYAVFGGTHLAEADLPRIQATISALKAMGMSILGFSHCSGELVEQVMRQDQQVKSCHMAVGDYLVFE